MDEMTALKEFRADVPTHGPSDLVRQRVLGTPPPPRWRRRTLATIAAAAAGATVLAIGLQLGPGAGPSAAVVLDRAAAHVAADPVSEPRPDQWIYENYVMAKPDGTIGDHPHATWTRFDGTAVADHPSPQSPLHVQQLQATGITPQQWYDGLAALPDDPAAVLARLRTGTLVRGGGDTEAARDFDAVATCLATPRVMPAAAHALLFRALATIPGVAIAEEPMPDLLGRDVVSVTFSGVIDDGAGFRSQQELLLDPATYEYRGTRVTALEDGAFDDGRPVTEGQVWYNDAVIDADVVDAAGDLP